MGTKSGASHAANNVTRKIKEHVFSKGVRQMCDQGPLVREGALLMVSEAFAVALSWMHIRKRCPIIRAFPRGPHQNDQDQWAHTSAAFP